MLVCSLRYLSQRSKQSLNLVCWCQQQTFLPPSKRTALDKQLETDDVEAIFSMPPIPDLSDELQSLISANLAPSVPEEVPVEEEPPAQHHDDRDFDDTRASEYTHDEFPDDYPPQEPTEHFEVPPVGEKPDEVDEERREERGERKTPDVEDQDAELEVEAEDVAPTAVTGGLSKQTLKIMDFLRTEFEEKGRDESLATEDLFEGKTRKAVASTFFEILVLRTRGFVEVKQDEPYGNIELTASESLFEA